LTPPVSESADVAAKLRTFICAELLRRPDYPLASDEPLISGGLIDSFALARIGVFVESTFQVEIGAEDLATARIDTLDALVAVVLEARRR
jgi:acyl carrier protein